MSNQTLQVILTIGGVAGALALFAGGLGLLINAYKKKPREERNDVISSADQLANFWKEQVEGFKAIVAELTAKLEKQKDDHTNEMKKVLTELGEVRGQLAAETKQKAEYLSILQDKDPKAQEFKEYMVRAVENQAETNKEMIRILSEIHTMVKQEHDRDLNITATVTKQ